MSIPTKMIMAGQAFVLPFRATGLWVEDARGYNVCEAANASMAKALAEPLNKQAQGANKRLI